MLAALMAVKCDLGYIIFVLPSSWRSPAGTRRQIFNTILERDLVYLYMCSYVDSNENFKGVEVYSTTGSFIRPFFEASSLSTTNLTHYTTLTIKRIVG